MKAAVIDVDRVTVESIPDPTPGPREVVVAVAACGICGTDLHIADGEFAPTLPVTPGHEFAGEVVAVGTAVDAAVDGVRVGDQVAVDPSLYCGECYFCQRGRGNMCERWRAIGVTATGGAAEYVAAPVANCVVLPGDVRPVDAALVEPLSCAVHGFDVLAPALGDHYLIYGAGTMGLMMMELAKRAGAASVSVVDLNPARLVTARELGCSAAVGSADELDRPRGWDNVIDCTGVVAAIEDGLPRVIKGGTFQQFGVANEDATARFNPFVVYNQEIRIIGSMAVLHSFDRAAQLLAEGVLRPDVMISDRKPLDDYPAALEQFRAGVGRKIQVTPHPR
ncbi:MAG TPA: zinc-dependent alcohol dehydrogenase family protein [Pseudonocardia sp.]|jgi:2-desacetyl-2-hydroxyethyl bacteriochlorophyllide A dehydrogenase|nr:zinc-dependent alcohol dehydrogenase family protein [Pseudonocardia sp.]